MKEAVVHVHRGGRMAALVGNPNCGKTALFNLLTGSRQKVANYAGVTVERKEGKLITPAGKSIRLLDLPGTYSLHPRSQDERVTCNVLNGRAVGEKRPDLVICVVDATNLRRSLRLVLAVKRLGLPCVATLNMADMAARRGVHIDMERLSAQIGMPVVSTVAIKGNGADDLLSLFDDTDIWHSGMEPVSFDEEAGQAKGKADHESVLDILRHLGLNDIVPHLTSDRIDRVVLHPVAGPIILMIILFLVFQAVFSWAEAPMTLIKAVTDWVSVAIGNALPEGWVRSLIVDGVIAGAGGVVVFLPQILILFFFILLLEESGYLPRAAFLLDRIMGSVGLSGRSFIPLLSSFACAIPGIMAARTIANTRDRMVTILIAPLLTCSARLPVYALLIGAFIPKKQVWGGIELQGLVLFGLYLAGIVGAMAIAWLLKIFTTQGQVRTLMMELPTYHWPTLRNLAIGLWQRAEIFMRRVGGIILTLTIALWFLSSFPGAPPGATGAAIEYSFAGMLGHLLSLIFAPIGFNWQISIALVPGLAAREVAISALGTVYALSATGPDAAKELVPFIVQGWSMATAMSLLAWYVFAPQCMSTLATVKRETGGWTMPLVMVSYMFTLAYIASFITYRVTLALMS